MDVMLEEETVVAEKPALEPLTPESVARDFARFKTNPADQMALRPRYFKR